MSAQLASAGRRERNKQQKLERITAAAAALFAEYGVEDVTTQQIAEKADVGTGTVFLYAKTKGELLLLVQNAHYAEALEKGRHAAEAMTDALDAVMALLRPIIECNRVQIDNGRTYLREMVFGSVDDERHAEALSIVGSTEDAVARILSRGMVEAEARATTQARVVSAIMFLTMAATVNATRSIDDLADDIRRQIAAVIGR